MKNFWEVKEVKPGDMIRIYNGVYYHYAIYLGNNQIIQFGTPAYTSDTENIKVEIVNSSEFTKYGFIEVRNYTLKEKLKKRKPEDIIMIAKSKLGQNGYDFKNNNCLNCVEECVFKK